MIDPRQALDAGVDSILPFLRAHDLIFETGATGPGSGGSFASGSLVAGDRYVRLSYRSGLGAITLEAEGRSIGFNDYLRVVGASSDARYPWTRSGDPDQFKALAHDLAKYCTEFLRGDLVVFRRACSTHESQSPDRMIGAGGDTRARKRAREAFRRKEYDDVVKLIDALKYPNDMSPFEQKMYAVAQSRLAPEHKTNRSRLVFGLQLIAKAVTRVMNVSPTNRELATEPDPQDLLPPELRTSWVVVPKHELYQVLLSGFLVGAGTVTSVVGFVSGPKYLRYGFPVAYILARLQAFIGGRLSDRKLEQLAGLTDGTPDIPAQTGGATTDHKSL